VSLTAGTKLDHAKSWFHTRGQSNQWFNSAVTGWFPDDVSALSEARPHKKRGERDGALGRAFDKAVRRKPLAGAADAGCYGNSIDFCLKSLARRGL
jgi:hypothetical protein